MDITIEHQPEQNRFISIIDGHKCILTYRITSDRKIWDYNHTYTAPELRGQGIAEKITKFAMDYARENGIKVIAGCSYVEYFKAHHPEYQDLFV